MSAWSKIFLCACFSLMSLTFSFARNLTNYNTNDTGKFFTTTSEEWQHITTEWLSEDDTIGTTAISADGKTISVGTRYSGEFLYKNGEWSHIKFAELPGYASITTTAISTDGETISLGANKYWASIRSGCGELLYKNGKWSRVTKAGLPGYASVKTTAVSADGKTISVGTWRHGEYLYQDGTWARIKKAGLPGDAAILSTAVSADAKTISVGTDYNGEYLYQNGEWSHITTSAGLPGNVSACSTAVSADGKTISVGTDGYGEYLYQDGAWSHITKAGLPGDAVILSTAVSADGKTISVGTMRNGEYLYQNGSWFHITSAGLPGDTSIESTAVSADGKTISVGTGGQGEYLYQNGAWAHITNAGLPGDAAILSTAVSADGKTISVGTFQHGEFLYSSLIPSKADLEIHVFNLAYWINFSWNGKEIPDLPNTYASETFHVKCLPFGDRSIALEVYKDDLTMYYKYEKIYTSIYTSVDLQGNYDDTAPSDWKITCFNQSCYPFSFMSKIESLFDKSGRFRPIIDLGICPPSTFKNHGYL